MIYDDTQPDDPRLRGVNQFQLLNAVTIKDNDERLMILSTNLSHKTYELLSCDHDTCQYVIEIFKPYRHTYVSWKEEL